MKWMLLGLILTLSAVVSKADDTQKVVKDGKLSAPMADDKVIVAVLHTEDPNAVPAKKGKAKSKSAPASETISLVASGELATKLKDFTAKNTFVEVSGTMADGKMTVSDVKELSEPSQPKKKKK